MFSPGERSRFRHGHEKLDGILAVYSGQNGLQITYPWESRNDRGVLCDSDSGRWFGVFMTVPAEKLGLKGSVYDVIEVPFDPKLIPVMATFVYCHEAVYMDPKSWLMLVILDDIPINTYLTMLKNSYSWLCGKPDGSGMAETAQKVYADTPLPVRGVFQNRRKHSGPDELPLQIAKMKEIYDQKRPQSPEEEAEVFYEQAVLMKDYTDDFIYHGVPWIVRINYHALTDRQLRGYFSWRTYVRENGDLTDTAPDCFIRLYAYELVLGIHSEPADTLAQLKALQELCPDLHYEMKRMINDFVVYHGLPFENFESVFAGQTDERHLRNLLEASGDESILDDDQLWEELRLFYQKEIGSSKFMRESEDDVLEVCLKVFRKGSRKWKGGIARAKMFASIRTEYTMFRSVPFYDPLKHADCTYWISDNTCYRCENGSWYLYTYHPDSGAKDMIREIDRQMRIASGSGNTLKDRMTDTKLKELIRECILEYLAEKKKASMPKVEIDMSRLSGIRYDAAKTRDSLIIEEEEDEEEIPEVPVLPQEQESVFSADEKQVLRQLLAGEKAVSSVSVAMVCDNINEKMMEELGDTVIEFDGDEPFLVEDYRDDLLTMLGGEQ